MLSWSWIGNALKISLISLAILAIITLVAVAMFSDFMYTVEQVTTEAPLVAMSISSGVEGSAEGNLLSLSADSSTDMYYSFYLRNTDGSLQLHKALAADNRVFIMEDVQSIDDTYVRVTFWYRIYSEYAIVGKNRRTITAQQLTVENFANFTKSRNFYGLARLEIHLPPDTVIPRLDANIQ